MKTKHLSTLVVFFAVTSSGMLLNEVSASAEGASTAIAQGTPNGARTSDKKTAETKAEKNTPPPEVPSTTSTPGSSTPSPAATNAVQGVSKTDSDDALSLPLLLGILLHLLEIAGLIGAYFKINQLIEKNRDTASQITSLKEQLGVSEQKLKTQGEQLKTIGSETAKTRNLTSRMNAIEQAAAQQRYGGDVGYASPGYNLPSPEAANTPPPSEYPFLDIYRQNPDNFKHKYAPKVVSEDADNLQKRRAGDYQEIILGEDRQGNYWLFNDGSTTYLIPSPKLKVNDLNIRTAGGLFACENYTPGYQHVTIVRPAIVSVQLSGNERWKLEQKGVLEFT